SFKRSKDKRDGDRYLALPHVVIDSPSYRELGYPARALLIDIARQYTGSNNGRLVACAKYLKPFGWNSNSTVTRALVELKSAGLLIETRMGMRPNRAAWFALGWYQLDATAGMDIDPRTFRTGGYKVAALIPRDGIGRARTGPFGGVGAPAATPAGGAMA
ncbi:MAG: hypothetical protein H7274_05555, partial [Rhodoferax sp.]|nr:hypothetical protein [Rhodoferax sp.]